MARQLLIQITDTHPTAASRVTWLFMDNHQVEGNITQGKLAEAAAIAGSAKVIVIVPGEVVFLTRQVLPGKNRQRLLQAIPFAIEDQLIDDVDDMHFALGESDGQGQYWIAAVSHRQMQEWQTLFIQAGLNPQGLTPDIALLPSMPGELHLLCAADRSLLSLPDQERLVIDSDNLALILKKISHNPELSINKVECYSADRSLDLSSMVAAHVSAEVSARVSQPLALFAETLGEGRLPINLLQGDYSRREKRQHQFRPWYPAAAMLAIWIMARLVMAGVDNIRYSNQLDALVIQQQQVYQQAFPSAKPGGDVYRKMEARLKELKQRHGTADASFYHMLNKLAPALRNSSGLQLQTLRYREGQLELDIQLPTLQALDQLKASLANQAQWQVEIQSASSAKNHVEARLQIRGQS